MKAPTPLRDASLSAGKPAAPPIPGTLIVLRKDRDTPQTVLESQARYARPPFPLFGREVLTLRWMLTERAEGPGMYPYIRASSDSRWGVRVDILGEGK